MKKSTVLQLILAVLLWSIPIIITLVVILSLCFHEEKYFKIDQDEYIYLENYRWGFLGSDKPRYLGKDTETNSDGEAENYNVYALRDFWSKKYLGRVKRGGLFTSGVNEVYMLKNAKEPIMFMDVEENQDAVTINSKDFQIEKIVHTIRYDEPETYNKDDFQNCLEESVHIYLLPTKKAYIRFSCKLLYDSEFNQYYVIRYDSLDECYYMYELAS